MNRDHKIRIIASYLGYKHKMPREKAILFALTKNPDQRHDLLVMALTYFRLKERLA